MYCIYQKTYENQIENIISNIKTPDAFLSTVQNIITDIYKINYIVAENSDILITGEDGFYLLCENDEITLVSRKTTLNQGYIYNTTNIQTEPIYLWKLIPFQLPVSSEIVEDSNKQIIVSDDEVTEVIRMLILAKVMWHQNIVT